MKTKEHSDEAEAQ